jgi:hypothetical protein
MDRPTPHRRTRRAARRRLRPRRPSRRALAQVMAALAVALPLAVALGLLAPEPAQASCSMGLSFSISDCADKAAETVIGKTFDMLFGGIQAAVTQAVLTYLTAIPSFAHDGHIQALSDLTTGLAFGALGAVMTISIIRYWLSGLSLSGQGGAEAIEGFTKTVWAALMILAWPWVFDQAIALTNIATSSIMESTSVRNDLKTMFRDFTISHFVPGPSMIISLVAELAGVFALLGLLWMKISLTAGTAFLRIAMPIAIVLWPIEELSWVARTAGKAMSTVVLVPLIWALLFATAAALGIGVFHVPTDGNNWLDQLVRPLAADAVLISAITIPKNLLKSAYQPGGGSRGGLASIASYLALRQAASMMGGGKGGGAPTAPTPNGGPQDPLRATAERIYPNRTALPSGRMALPAGPSGGGPGPGGGGGPGGPGPGGPGHGGRRHGGPPGGPQRGGPGGRPRGGAPQSPPFDREAASRFQRQMQESARRGPGPSAEMVSNAQSSLSSADQWRLHGASERFNGRIQPLTAQMMAEPGRDRGSQSALWTIGTASLDNRAAGMFPPTGPAPPGGGGGGGGPRGGGSAPHTPGAGQPPLQATPNANGVFEVRPPSGGGK